MPVVTLPPEVHPKLQISTLAVTGTRIRPGGEAIGRIWPLECPYNAEVEVITKPPGVHHLGLAWWEN